MFQGQPFLNAQWLCAWEKTLPQCPTTPLCLRANPPSMSTAFVPRSQPYLNAQCLCACPGGGMPQCPTTPCLWKSILPQSLTLPQCQSPEPPRLTIPPAYFNASFRTSKAKILPQCPMPFCLGPNPISKSSACMPGDHPYLNAQQCLCTWETNPTSTPNAFMPRGQLCLKAQQHLCARGKTLP